MWKGVVLSIKYHLRAFKTDQINRLRFGDQAPRYAETIWVTPTDCKRYIEAADLAAYFGDKVRRMSGRVINEWPDSLELPLESHPKLGYCWAHWRDGKSWAEAGAIDFMLGRISVSPTGMTDKCRNLEDVEQRFEALDQFLSDARERGRLPTSQEWAPDNFREVGGILMHIGPGGLPVFSGAGCHRFAMALMLDAPFPAQLGVVHVSALDKLRDMRLPSKKEE